MNLDLAAVLQTFREKPSQPEKLVLRLANVQSLAIQILVHDDSGEQSDAWQRFLRPTDVYVRSNNIHEVRAYNKLARLANASIIVFLQGDNCMPRPSEGSAWLHEALYLFARMPRLAVLGGHAGFDNPSLESGVGPYPRRKPIPFFVEWSGQQRGLSAAVDASTHFPSAVRRSRAIAFAHVYGVNIGPYFVRKQPFLDAGGFTQQYGNSGEPGGHFDVELCTRMWIGGFFSCGVYYGTVGNGVGGHKTRLGKQAKMRKRNQQRAFAHLWEQWREHNGTIGARLTNENGQLLQWNPDVARQMQIDKPESARSCGGKHGR